jgi:hypothetical protein
MANIYGGNPYVNQDNYGGLGSLLGIGGGDPTNWDRGQIEQNAGAGNALGALGMGNYGAAQQGLQSTAGQLQAIASGQLNPSATQFAQQNGALQAAQQSMAASASPSNQAAAAFNASRNMAQLGYGMSGQQALAGQQAQMGAINSLGSLYGQMGQLGVNAATGGYGAANQGYGTALGTPQKTIGNYFLGALGGAAGALGKM